jgi:hypothetical protein
LSKTKVYEDPLTRGPIGFSWESCANHW